MVIQADKVVTKAIYFFFLIVFIYIQQLNATRYLYKNKKGVYSYNKIKNHENSNLIKPVKEMTSYGPMEKNSSLIRVIKAAANKYRIDTALIMAIIKAESNFYNNAISPAGAEGLMQIMPTTALQYGVLNPFDYRENIFGGTRYLRYLLNIFMGNLHLTLAAYNAGEKAVFRYGTIPPYQETQEYVKKVMSYYNVYLYRKFKANQQRLQRKMAEQKTLLEKTNKSTELIAKNDTVKKIKSSKKNKYENRYKRK